MKEIIYKNVDGLNLKLYEFLPQGKASGCVICIHGGGWKSEDTRRFFRHCEYFADNGAIAYSVQYRIMQDGKNTDVRDCLKDCADAVKYIKNNLNVSIPISVLGDSAGGYLAACLGVSAIIKRLENDFSLPDYVVDLNGIVDLTGKWSYGIIPRKNENCEDLLKEFSPLYNVAAGDSPVLIMHGTNDSVVALSDAENYYDKLKKVKIDCELKVIDNAKHAFILFDYTHENAFVQSVLDTIVNKLKEKNLL